MELMHYGSLEFSYDENIVIVDKKVAEINTKIQAH